jgi:hypothetical protein
MRRLVVSAALVLVVAGCGGDPKADPTTTPSSPSTSVTPTATPPVMPEAAKANTKAGAVAFVKHYIDLINYAQATGHIDVLAAVEDPGCDSCGNGRSALARIYSAGGVITGGKLSFRFTSAAPSPRYRGWLISGSLHFAPQIVVRQAGESPENLTGGTTPANAFVSSTNASHEWRVMDWTRGS